jgi:hypothetical protein
VVILHPKRGDIVSTANKVNACRLGVLSVSGKECLTVIGLATN